MRTVREYKARAYNNYTVNILPEGMMNRFYRRNLRAGILLP